MTASGLTDGIREFLLAFADDEHLMGQQHAEWIGVAPFLEEDLAFCSIGQDELAHAASLYAIVAGDGDPTGVVDPAIDELAFHRDPADWRSCRLVEEPFPAVGSDQQNVEQAVGLFDPVPGEDEAVAAGVAAAPFDTCLPTWTGRIRDRFGVDPSCTVPSPPNGRRDRSPAFTPLLERMREVFALDPTATW